ncbi:MAG TPA: response regulator [Verrucomicrobiae bacterium]|nr:response regulator [Verrucomicrobiae bacterium]
MAISLQLVETSKKEKPSVKPKEKEAQPFNETKAGAEGDAPPSIGQNRTILVVDDNPVVVKAFELKLQANGFKVVTITNGGLVASTAEQVKPNLIILDINFPPGGNGLQWTGFTILQWIKRFPELAGIPVIFISGDDAAKCKEKALAAGAAAFFQKPADYDQLLAAIVKILGK